MHFALPDPALHLERGLSTPTGAGPVAFLPSRTPGDGSLDKVKERVLFVDDDANIGDLVCLQLKPHGYQVDLATDAASALQMIEENHYHALITDLRMPEIDGIELIRRLHSRHPELAVVLVSGDPMLDVPEDRQVDEALISVIQKPWELRELLASLSRAIQITRQREAKEENRQGLQRILLIEDSDSDAAIFEELCLDGGITGRVTVVGHLSKAIEHLRDRPWDMVVTDLSLPDARGVDTVQRLRQTSSSVPLIVLSGNIDADASEQVLRLGAQECLSKDELTARSLVRNMRHAVERKVSEERLLRAAYEDSLTGLGNRAFFRSRLRHALARARRGGTGTALLFLDLDRFKEINDGWGHHAGDAVLTEVASRLASTVRGEDALARLGGDEFALLLEDILSVEDATRVADRILALLSQPYLVAGELMEISPSIGIALFPDHAKTEEQLLRLADQAMYRAKAAGGNQTWVFEGDGAPKPARFVVERELRQALERDQFQLFFQPQVGFTDDRTVGCEALIRWRRAEDEMVPPGEFISALEETGQICEVGRWVIDQACDQLRRWCDLGLGGFTLSLNVSPRQFEPGDLPETVEAALERTGIDPSRLEIEITEAVVIKDLWRSTEQIEQIRRLGVRVALDDFGTGYSSLAILHRVPIDVLKIDRSFVGEIESSEESLTLVKAILDLGHQLGLEVVAEGVETQGQFDLLRSHRCDRSQGYLHAKPLPLAEFEAYLAATGLLAVCDAAAESSAPPENSIIPFRRNA